MMVPGPQTAMINGDMTVAIMDTVSLMRVTVFSVDLGSYNM